MPQESWSEQETDTEIDPISSLLSEWSDPEAEEEDFRSDFFQGLAGRRRKSAFALMLIWGIVIALHSVTWGLWFIAGFTGLLIIQAIRLVNAKPDAIPAPLSDQQLLDAPSVSLLVAAKNEEAVISKLVRMLCNLDYPLDKYEVFVIDDHSSDRTPQLLDQLTKEYSQLRVIHRGADGTGGKSGALNEALEQTKGDIIAVFDADAQVSRDLLRNVVPMFIQNPKMGAVQVRKAIANAGYNFWTKGQATEMALDAYFQQQRIAINGIGELRGNGQFVLRKALNSCGGWNEQTITDDLDLTIRLHLDHWKIGFLLQPAVGEEGVTSAIALWHQRSRWAEGGYQRYLDYWRWILKQPIGIGKRIDLVSFMLIQYLLPTAAIPDLVMTVYRHQLPVLSPMTGLMFYLSFWAMFSGIRRSYYPQFSFGNLLNICQQTLLGMIYMIHWLVVMPVTTARMSIRPKTLKWVKTVHQGATGESFSEA